MSTFEDILADVIVFLKDTLDSEELSVTANQRRIALLQKILSRDPISFSYVDMNGSHKSNGDTESPGECYEELESTWSGSAASSNTSRTYSNTLPATSKHQRFSFFFGNGLGDSKSKDQNKNCADTVDFPNDASKRNSVLSDSDNSLSPSSVKSEDSLEIMSISASALKYSAVKCGVLVRKEKTLFIEHSKRFWVALLGTTLFIYNNEKDAKPVYNINVDDYNARPIVSAQTTKKEFGFEIVCPGKKTYQFYSGSKTEMETWILSINHSLPLPQTSSVISALSQPSSPLCADQLDSKLIEYSEKRNRDSGRYECADNPADRELPSLPMYLHYDTPNPVCRSVKPDRTSDTFSCSFNDFQETFYHSIDESIAERLASYDYPTRHDPVNKHKNNSNGLDHSQEDNLYYNILDHIRVNEKSENNLPSNEHTKNTSVSTTEEKDHVCHKKGLSRIRQLIQKMEEINNQNTSCNKIKVNSLANESKLLNSHHQASPLNEEIYELVNSPTYVNINA